MKCPKCQHENPDAQKFCGECGYNLRDVAGIPSKRFTHPKSYTPKFLVDKILTNKSVIEGERKLVTVFFADVAGFSSFSEKLDPEQVHRIMDGAFRIMMDEIHEYEGTINQFTGDGVMALFGAPVAHENHAQRACHAALAIQKAMVEYSKEVKKDLGVNFKMRAGLNTGPVVVGSIGDDLRMDYTAVGDTVNLASRMESTATPGAVLVSNNTYKRVKQHFKFTSLGKVKVKGKEIPLDVYELVDSIERPKSGLDRQIVSEMVGREKDLNKLEIQVMKAVNGEGSVVNIIGEAGIGKSRLVAELKNREIMKQVTLLEGRAISMGRNLSFHPVIDLLKEWARIIEDDNEAAALSKLETAIRQVYPEEIQEVLPFVATLMGMKLSGRYAERIKGIEGEALEKLILKNVRELLIKATQLRPLVIVIEDLHWADMSSIELMESLLRLAETQRIIFVNVFRPGHKDTGERIIETIKEKLPVYYVEIVLQPLDESMSETFINNILNIKGLQLSVIDQIVERSGGNPFFIEEVVRSFIDEGAVVSKDGAFEVTEKINSMVIPHTINDVLMARIDRLEEKTRNLVKVASVIGRSFFYRVLTEVAQTVEDIDNRLSYLKEIQLIRDRRRLEELEYLFKHALAQEAAYGSILHQKKKEIHLDVAKAIESVFSEKLHEFYGMLAFHYSRGEDLSKAEEYLIRAGEEALKSSASTEALDYYQRALQSYNKTHGDNADPDRVAMMEKNIAIALFNKFRWTESVQHMDRVLECWHEKTDHHQSGIICNFIKNALFIVLGIDRLIRKVPPTSHDSEVLDLIYRKGQALAVLDRKQLFFCVLGGFNRAVRIDLAQSPESIGLFIGTAVLLSYLGFSYKLSNRLFDNIKSKISADNTKNLIGFTMAHTISKAFSGDWEKIENYFEDHVDAPIRKGYLMSVAAYLYWYAFVKLEQGELDDVEHFILKLSDIAVSYDFPFAKSNAGLLKAYILIVRRELSEAIAVSYQNMAFVSKMTPESHRLVFTCQAAMAFLLSKDFDKTNDMLKRASEIIESQGNLSKNFLAPYLVARFETDITKLKIAKNINSNAKLASLIADAVRSGNAALVQLRNYAPFMTRILKLKGEFFWTIGKQRKALRWWSKAIKKGEALGARPDLARTYMEIGKRLLEDKSKYKELNGISAQEYLEKAREMFQEMDLQWDLDELKKIEQQF